MSNLKIQTISVLGNIFDWYIGLLTSLPLGVEIAVFDFVATVPDVEADVASLLNIFSICKVSIVVLSIDQYSITNTSKHPQIKTNQCAKMHSNIK